MWNQRCWKCHELTEVITYIIKDDVIGSNENVDEILKQEYDFIDRLFSKTMNEWTIGNKCQHCQAFQGNGFISHDLVLDRHVDYEHYDEFYPIVRILSIGHLSFLDGNPKNKTSENLRLVCFDCHEKNLIIKGSSLSET